MATKQAPKEEKIEPKIRIAEPEATTLTFSTENQEIMKEMIEAKYGESEKDLIINALTILYTIAKKAPNAKDITVQGEDGKITIPITRVP